MLRWAAPFAAMGCVPLLSARCASVGSSGACASRPTRRSSRSGSGVEPQREVDVQGAAAVRVGQEDRGPLARGLALPAQTACARRAGQRAALVARAGGAGQGFHPQLQRLQAARLEAALPRGLRVRLRLLPAGDLLAAAAARRGSCVRQGARGGAAATQLRREAQPRRPRGGRARVEARLRRGARRVARRVQRRLLGVLVAVGRLARRLGRAHRAAPRPRARRRGVRSLIIPWVHSRGRRSRRCRRGE